MSTKIINNIKILYFDRIVVSEGIDVSKTSESKECNICHYWRFINKGFKFQTYVYNRCPDLLMMPMNLSNNADLKIKNTDYLCIITGIRKNESLMLLQNIDLTEKVWNILKLNIKSNFEALNLLQILI